MMKSKGGDRPCWCKGREATASMGKKGEASVLEEETTVSVDYVEDEATASCVRGWASEFRHACTLIHVTFWLGSVSLVYP
jgi:hypothetical protein